MKASRPVTAKKHPGRTHERLGAHVSTQGGVQTAPARGVDIGATAIQIFTKTPNQWREPVLDEGTVTAFRRAYEDSGMNGVVAHDSYLINLASPDPALTERSIASFVAELTRCHQLGLDGVVSHPGNYLDDREAGLQRNAQAYTKALRAAPGEVMVLLETTAGTGTALGSRFEELAALRALVPDDLRHRIGFCADTCHIYSAGYDIVNAYDAVMDEWDRLIGLEHLRCFHLNDSKTPFDSHKDRHELIAEGSLGAEPFRRIMRDERFRDVIKVLETPKGDDMVTNDRRMLRRLRAYARGGRKSVR
ncbi:MAG TPA: deoxyribonuclease IV [Gemmatimonadales bacterium]|nr:deoxyribonuclease IV [Gemmatimonadales bacterium]